MDELNVEMCVRGYHVYRRIWEAAINEELVCTREPQNSTDCYAVAVIKDGRIVGTYPEKYLASALFF